MVCTGFVFAFGIYFIWVVYFSNFFGRGETQIEWDEEKESSVNKGKSRFRHPAIRGANDPWRIEKISRSVDLLPSKHSSRDIPSLTLVKLQHKGTFQHTPHSSHYVCFSRICIFISTKIPPHTSFKMCSSFFGSIVTMPRGQNQQQGRPQPSNEVRLCDFFCSVYFLRINIFRQ